MIEEIIEEKVKKFYAEPELELMGKMNKIIQGDKGSSVTDEEDEGDTQDA